MTGPNMATITASLEQSMQNCSLNRDGSGAGGGVGLGLSATSDEPENLTNTDTAVELNSHVALPYEWEQCLDLKTGELYYIDWQKGTKAKEDPRKKTSRACVGVGVDFYTEEDSSSYGYGGYGYEYDSEGSSSTSTPSPSPSRDDYRYEGDHVLVVAGCKRCFMYFMLPKQVGECPQCNGLILHFDRSENASHEI
ncbi:uncharacterized protein LOC122653902 [Telopea speciosissima]|uniref:uncharacterized protein LOC122653902 n=1 Tax=Telopea speciosissima TaxID=54955 RepID=UPI001CC6BA32|nr:uncharacterized protein LOC122653902 [Telopea speciosissima]XP_043703794.1 uncharacterized protein LOC122653902 [Telopea speciosissima]